MYSGEQLVDLLSAQGVEFGRYHEGMSNIPGVCPFHVSSSGTKKTPFYVYVGNPTSTKMPGASFCHRCNEGWSLVGLLRKLNAPRSTIDQISKYLSIITRPKRVRGTNDIKAEFEFFLPEVMLGSWEYIPRKMLEWGFTKETIQYFDIGFDRSEKRITFPIRDHHGRLVGVSGRATRSWQTRYRFYEEELYEVARNYTMKKGLALWSLDKVYETRMRSGTRQPPLVLFEGFKANMWAHQCGVPHTVSSMGSSLTRAQIRLLTCVGSGIILFWDNDTAGRQSTNKHIQILRNCGLQVQIADYDTLEEISPDDLGEQSVHRAVENALSPRQWRRKYGETIQQRC